MITGAVSSTIRPFPRARLMTMEEFERWAIDNSIRPMVAPPYRLIECDCGDINCHGWRFIGVGTA